MLPIICLMGPTASGKSNLAIQLTEVLPCEIISVDSVMVYRGMDIGSAKPSTHILKKIPHGLIDILDPKEIYSAGQFFKDAWGLIEAICARGKIPLLCGGTMLYFKILWQGISVLPEADPALRAKINLRACQMGWQALHQELSLLDPVAAARIKDTDSQRIQRALEVYYLSGKPISAWQQQNQTPAKNYQIHKIALRKEGEALQQAIAERLEHMLAAGFLSEVEALFSRRDLHPDLPSIRSVGYQEAWQHLAQQLSYKEMCEKIVVKTRQLAKRQMTWLRSFQDVAWLTADEAGLLEKVVNLTTR